MVTRVDPFLGGLGIDATNKFEVASNATVTVGNGTSTGNVNVGGEVVSSTVDATTLKIGGTAVTSTATELNYVDGVTSAIQTQLDGKLATAGSTMTGDVLYNDSVKVKFGTDSDLEIYHDGSNSYIKDVGTGNLNLLADGNVNILNAAGTEFKAQFVSDGTVNLFYDNSKKFETDSAGVTITGNIAVTGTVDGRDVATDGTKLDGIESGATADQTASEILTAIKTVDGSGSGLDADTVDGIQAASFLRSDAADTATGVLTLNDDLLFANRTTTDGHILLYNGTVAGGYALGIEGSTLYYRSGFLHRWYIGTYADAGSSDYMELSTTGLTVNGKLQEGGNSLIPPGSIIMYGAAAAPGGYYLCEGAAISRSTYAALFAVISTTYGAGDGSTTFNVPDFRDRAPYGASTFTLGSKTAGEVNASGQNSTGTGTSGSSGASTVANNTGTGTTGTGTTGTATSGGTAPSIPSSTYNTGTGTSGGSGASTVAANTGNAGATTVASNTGSGGSHGHGVTTANTNSTTDKDVTGAIASVTAVANVGNHTHAIPALTVNAHAHSIPSLTVNSHTHTVPALSIPAMTVNSHTHSVPGLSIPGLSVPALTIPSLTVNGHTHSVPALTVTHPGVAVKFIIKT
jgi:microcystin-dependent protein